MSVSTITKSIIITGASSGLGRALAINYADKHIKLFLFGRDKNKLNETAKLCQDKGGSTNIVIADVCDQELMIKKLLEITTNNTIDIVIANAGVSAGTLGGIETIAQITSIFETNINGVINTIMPIVPSMIKRRSGSIVLISSMAGLIGLSSSPSYCASKSAIMTFGEAMRGYCKPHKVKVSVVVPGYIDTPMTKENHFPMPFILSSDSAADKIIKQVAKGKGMIIFPKVIYYAIKLVKLLPNYIIDWINSKLPSKSSRLLTNKKK